MIDQIVSKVPIHKGWSGDQKYRVTDGRGKDYLLRVSPAEQYDRKRLQFHRMEQIAALGIPMCRPVEFGLCQEGVYSIQSWIDGEDAEVIIPQLPAADQYTYGCDAGHILRQLHTLPAPSGAESWAVHFGRKIDRKIAMYEACPLKYEQGHLFLAHIANTGTCCPTGTKPISTGTTTSAI